jgi:hypothetical protein
MEKSLPTEIKEYFRIQIECITLEQATEKLDMVA